MVERLRISVSRIFVALVAILVLVSASRWETRLPIVASILFFRAFWPPPSPRSVA